MIDHLTDLAQVSLRAARGAGAEYAEARIHAESGQGFMLKNGDPQPSMLDDSVGIGVRVICGGALAFSATNAMDRASVRETTLRAVKMAKASKRLLARRVPLDDSKAVRRTVRVQEKEKIEGGDPVWLRSLLADIDGRLKGGGNGPRIASRMLAASVGAEEKYYVNSDGAEVRQRVPRLSFFAILTATEGQVVQRMVQQGETGGLEAAKRLDLIGKMEREAKTLLKVLGAKKAPKGVLDVVLGPELSGIAAHESVGHPQEADRILGREGAQAGESYLGRDSLGTKVGSAETFISDDPTIPHSNGFCPVDDEGVKARKRRLIVGGRISEFLQNRSTAAELGMKNNGASRSNGYNREPIVRMSNTFVEPGDHSLEELLKEVKEGVYIKSFTEWNIDDKRLNQRYVGLEAYHIRRGELDGLVKAPVLEITTPALWSRVGGRSKTLEFEAASCGKGDPMQGIPVLTGGPDTLLKGVKLGAR